MPRLTLRDWEGGFWKLASVWSWVWHFEYQHCPFGPQSIHCLVPSSFALKNRASGRAEAKNFGFLKKKSILPLGYQTCSAKYMLFELTIYHQNKGEEVPLCCAISVYSFVLSVIIICLYLSVFTYVSTLKMHK